MAGIGRLLAPLLVVAMMATTGAYLCPQDDIEARKPSVLTVGAGGFTTITAALEAAKPYDIINVGEGVYSEPLFIDKPITLHGMGPKTIYTSMVTVTANDVTIDDDTFSGIVGATWDTAGIITKKPDSSQVLRLTVRNCVFTKCRQGVFLFGAVNCVIDGCTFDNCTRGVTIRGHNIGIGSYQASGNTIKNCKFYDQKSNGLWDGEAVAINGTGNCPVYNNVITDCTMQGNGYGVHIDSSTGNEVRACTITKSVYEPLSFKNVAGTLLVQSNTIRENGDDVVFSACTGFTFKSNTINGSSLRLEYSQGGSISGNAFEASGKPSLHFKVSAPAQYAHTIATDNTVGGNPLYYFYNVPMASVDQKAAGAIFMVNCNQPTVTGCTLRTGDGIMLMNTQGFTVSGTTVDDCLWGINISYANSGTVEKTSVNASTRGWHAIHAHSTSGVDVSDSALDAPGAAPAWRLTSATTVHSINTTFDGADVEVAQGGGGTLRVFNFMTVKVWDNGSLAPLEGAHVDIVEDTTALYRTEHFGGANPTTDATGTIGPIRCLDREYVSSNTATEHNHYAKVWASIDAEWSAEALDVDMSRPRLIEFEAADIRAPATPANLAATDVPAEDAIVVSWDASADDTLVYSVFWNASGTWALIQNVSVPGVELRIGEGLVNGTAYWFAASAWDEVPLQSPWAAAVRVLHVDGLAPAAPTGLRALSVNGTNVTIAWDANTDVDLVGYRVYINQSGAGANGPWQLITPSAGMAGTELWVRDLLSETDYHFAVAAIDETPNESPLSLVLSLKTLDITPPGPPTLDALVEYTNQATLTVTGIAEPGSTVTVFVGGAPSGTGLVAPDGKFEVAVQLEDGPNVITAWATDGSGNTGAPSAGATVILDRVAPPAPELDALPELTNIVTHVVSGTAEAHATVRVLRDGELLFTTIALTDGTFSGEVALTEGLNNITAIAVDRALNEGPASAVTRVVLDTIAPLPPDLSATPSYTNDETPSITGTAEPGAKVEVLSGTTVLVTVDADGEGSFTATIRLSDRETTIRARATDRAGNVGEPCDARTIILDMEPPATNAGPDVSEVEEVGVTLNGSASADNEGIANYTWTFTVGTDVVTLYGAVVTHTFADPVTVTAMLTATDLAGNTATDSALVTIRAKNLPPVLRGGTLDPKKGDTGTNFKFEVIFADADGDTGEVYVFIDNQSFKMTPDPADTDSRDGRKYTYTTKLAQGPHTYYFMGTDSFGNEAGGESAGPGAAAATGEVTKKKVKSPGLEAVAAVAALAAALVAARARRRR